MSCETCLTVCPIFQTYTNLSIGKIGSNSATVDVFIENVATGRVHIEESTTSATGVVTLAAGTWNELLKTQSELKVWVQLDGSSEKQQIFVFDNTDTPTFDSDSYECIVFTTQPLYDDDGANYLMANQKLQKP